MGSIFPLHKPMTKPSSTAYSKTELASSRGLILTEIKMSLITFLYLRLIHKSAKTLTATLFWNKWKKTTSDTSGWKSNLLLPLSCEDKWCYLLPRNYIALCYDKENLSSRPFLAWVPISWQCLCKNHRARYSPKFLGQKLKCSQFHKCSS